MERVKRAAVVLLFAALLLVPQPTVAAGGNPIISVSASDNRVAPGEVTSLQVTVMNAGKIEFSSGSPALDQRLTTARGTTVELRAGNAPIEVESGAVALGSVPETAVPAGFEIAVDENATPGTYRVPVDVSYTYTPFVRATGRYETKNVTKTKYVTLKVTRAAGFEVVSAATDAPVGGSGEVTVRLRNDGTATAHDATVSLTSKSSDLTLGASASATTFVGAWAPNETRTVTVNGGVARTASVRSLPLSATVNWRDEDGRPNQESLSLGITPASEQSFDVRDVESTLRVGAEGKISGRLVNQGPTDLENAVLILQPTGSGVTTTETEYALGDLAAGNATAFSYEVEVSSSARDGPRQFTYRLQYEGARGTTVTSDPLYTRATVEPSRDVFEVKPVDATFQAGKSGRLVVEVTNTGDEPVTDVSAKLFTDDPVSASDDQAFVDRLKPGQTKRAVFQVSVGGGAIAKAYPVSIDFQYTEPDGDTKLSDTFRIPVRVRESSGGFGLFAGAGAAALALSLVGGVIRLR